jgi:hypothetical protein
MLSRNIVLDEDLQKILQEEIAASNDKRIKSLIPSAAKINRLPASKPGISIGELLSEIKGPGYFYITLSNGSTKHGMACQINLEGVMQFIDPNGAVWEGTPDKVAAMVQTYWEQLGLTSWYKTSGIWSVWELWSKDALIIF